MPSEFPNKGLEPSNRYESSDTEQLEIRYSMKMIFIIERMIGYGWFSPGAEAGAREFFLSMKLKPGQKLLEIGPGAGGAAFYAARNYGVHVHGVDYSRFMIELANDRLSKQEQSIQDRVKFSYADILTIDLPKNSYDIIYTRDVFIHIREKEEIMKKIKNWLKPGGKLVMTDFCRGDGEISHEMIDYIKHEKFDLIPIKDYVKVVEDAGLAVQDVKDVTQDFIDHHKNELKFFLAMEEQTLKDFGRELYDEIVTRWKMKTRNCETKEQGWVYILASNEP